MWLPTPDDVLQIHGELVSLFVSEGDPIDPPGLRDHNLLESACTRPRTSLGGTDKYQTLDRKVAALFHSLAKNHAFHNGNKRTALATMLTTLARNDRRLSRTVTDDELYDMVLAVAKDEFPKEFHGLSIDDIVEELAVWLRGRNMARQSRPSTMKSREFLKKCSLAGAKVKESGSSYVVSFKMRSVRFSRSTPALAGNIVRQYLKRLRLTETQTGFTVEEFQEGLVSERTEIHRFIAVMRKLAHT